MWARARHPPTDLLAQIFGKSRGGKWIDAKSTVENREGMSFGWARLGGFGKSYEIEESLTCKAAAVWKQETMRPCLYHTKVS
jgi:hypothetical protein